MGRIFKNRHVTRGIGDAGDKGLYSYKTVETRNKKREVKDTFTKRHEINAKKMEEVKVSLAEIKSDLKILIEFIKEMNKKNK